MRVTKNKWGEPSWQEVRRNAEMVIPHRHAKVMDRRVFSSYSSITRAGEQTRLRGGDKTTLGKMKSKRSRPLDLAQFKDHSGSGK